MESIWWTATLGFAITPFTVFRNDGFSEKGEQDFSLSSIFFRSSLSLFNLTLVKCLCCSMVLQLRLFISRIVCWYLAVMEADIAHNDRCSSVIPLPRVSPPEVFKRLTAVFSITKSRQSQSQN